MWFCVMWRGVIWTSVLCRLRLITAIFFMKLQSIWKRAAIGMSTTYQVQNQENLMRWMKRPETTGMRWAGSEAET